MLTTKLKLSWGLAALTAASALAQTQTAAPAPAASSSSVAAAQPSPQPSGWDEWLTKVKNPKITWGGDVRLRNEYLNNALTLSDVTAPRHEQDYFRFRERVWTSIELMTNMTANARLAAEEREWMKPANASQYFSSLGPPAVSRSGFEERYGILDNAYIKWSNIGNVPLTITAGRQDMALGDPDDQFLVMDGTPGDGSWTFFFDSLRATYELKDVKTKVDLIYIDQMALPDEEIPTIGRSSENTLENGTPRPYYLTEQNEQGVIVYLSNKSVENMQLDGYFIYKGDHRTDTHLIKNGDDADIYTFGTKITGTPAEHWSYSAEAAYQFGSKQDSNVVHQYYVANETERRDISAYAGKLRVSYLFKDKMQNKLSLVGEFLSGDDPNTKGQDEMFDILWGRWPRWTELGTWNYATETGGRYLQMNNTGRVGPNWNVSPITGLNVNLMYNALFAPESTPTRDTTGTSATNPERFSKNGNFRGHYFQGIVKHQFNKYLTAQVKGELLCEGNYYNQRDILSFLRTEVMVTF
jgi:hypothetical protein